MQVKQKIIHIIKWLTGIALLVICVMCIRYFCIQSYYISTPSMEEALRIGDCVLVKKRLQQESIERNQILLFTSPLRKDSLSSPLLISRCIALPGDTIQVTANGYSVNNTLLPRSPYTLTSYSIKRDIKDSFITVLKRLNIPQRNWHEDEAIIKVSLTPEEEIKVREEMKEEINTHLVAENAESYSLIVPQKDRAYRLTPAALIACKEAILSETNGKAKFRNGKLFLDGRETNFFFFKQNYYWMLSDNANQAIDSRHVGFVPFNHLIGNVWFCWFSKDSKRMFKTVH